MIPGAIPLLVVSVLLGPALFLFPGQGVAWKRLRVLVHLLSIAGFAAAGSLYAVRGEIWSGLGFLAVAFVWTGAFWLASIARRLRHGPHAPVHRREGGGEAAEHGEDRRGGGERESDSAAETGRQEDLDQQEREILRRLLTMGEIRVSEIATPREKIVYADCSGGTSEVLGKMHGTRHPRIPMVDGSLDRIVGILHAKDLVPFILEGRKNPALKGMMRRPLFVPEDRTVANLLELFRSQRSHMAVVVDTYSRTVGLITRADLFRHLSGGGGGHADG
jgi:CBS domain containing-hemolysin-like protein